MVPPGPASSGEDLNAKQVWYSDQGGVSDLHRFGVQKLDWFSNLFVYQTWANYLIKPFCFDPLQRVVVCLEIKSFKVWKVIKVSNRTSDFSNLVILALLFLVLCGNILALSFLYFRQSCFGAWTQTQICCIPFYVPKIGLLKVWFCNMIRFQKKNCIWFFRHNNCYETIMFGRVTYARRRLRRECFSVYLIPIL